MHGHGRLPAHRELLRTAARRPRRHACAVTCGARAVGREVMVAGVKVASQTPAIRSGQRIIFLTLDDATGPVEVTVFESVQPKVVRTVFHGYALAVVGELRRTGVGGVSVVAEDVWDLSALHRARAEGRLRDARARSPFGPARRHRTAHPLARQSRFRGIGETPRHEGVMTPPRPSRAHPARRHGRLLRLGRVAEGPVARRQAGDRGRAGWPRGRVVGLL